MISTIRKIRHYYKSEKKMNSYPKNEITMLNRTKKLCGTFGALQDAELKTMIKMALPRFY